MVSYEYRCKNCLSGFLQHIHYEIFPDGKVMVRKTNACSIADGATDYIKPGEIEAIRESSSEGLDQWSE